MAKKLYEETDIQAIASAIRGKNGTTETYKTSEMADAITNIPTSGGSDDHTIEDSLITKDLSGSYSNSRVTKVGAYCLAYSKVTSASYPSATEVKVGAFESCTQLQSVNLPVCTEIASKAFNGCSTIAQIDLPELTLIGSSAFLLCSALTALILRSTTPVTSQLTFLPSTDICKNTPIASGTGYIYVPASLVDTYKVAEEWSSYANQFRALEAYTVDGTITGALDPNKI